MAMQNTASSSSDKNSILVNGKLIQTLRSALSQGSERFDRLPSTREILNFVVLQTCNELLAHPLYSVLDTEVDQSYKWFDSEVAQKLQNTPKIVDKGRFVDACIIVYLGREDLIKRYCVPSRLIRPRQLSEQQRSRIRTISSAIDDAKDVESEFEPMTSLTMSE